jgi:hypothetical protein
MLLHFAKLALTSDKATQRSAKVAAGWPGPRWERYEDGRRIHASNRVQLEPCIGDRLRQEVPRERYTAQRTIRIGSKQALFVTKGHDRLQRRSIGNGLALLPPLDGGSAVAKPRGPTRLRQSRGSAQCPQQLMTAQSNSNRDRLSRPMMCRSGNAPGIRRASVLDGAAENLSPRPLSRPAGKIQGSLGGSTGG